MTKEEQEALMYLKQCVISNIPPPSEALSWVKTIVILIDKLQKEIEQHKKELIYQQEQKDQWIDSYFDLLHTFLIYQNAVIATYGEEEEQEIQELVKLGTGMTTKEATDFISKDKIRDKIKELEKELSSEMFENEVRAKIEILQELLEEE